MSDLKVVGWTSFDSKYPSKNYSMEELDNVVSVILDEIATNNYIFSGEEHQYGLTGVPVLSDGTCFRCSMRCWGSLMAPVYEGPGGTKLNYMDFYMSLGEYTNMPEFKEFDLEPLTDLEQSDGYMIQEDSQVINEAMKMGMPLITTDKVLKKYFED